jgi:DNA polymerase/3'-5' exonuclease PolX
MKFSDLILWIITLICDADMDDVLTRKNARIRAYKKTIESIQTNHKPTDIVTKSKLSNMELTPYMVNKLWNHRNTSRELYNTIYTHDELLNKLSRIQGIGNIKATTLINKGVKSIDDLSREKYFKILSKETQVYLKYHPMVKIPRKTILQFQQKLLKLLNSYMWDIAGSYRRQKEYSRDIDIIIAYDGPIVNVMTKIKSIKPIVYSMGEGRASFLVKFKNKYLKIDLMKTIKSEYPFFLLYLTGSKDHNIKLRSIAKKRGMLLNQRGLFRNGKPIAVKNERGIFKHLDLTYVKPKDR